MEDTQTRGAPKGRGNKGRPSGLCCPNDRQWQLCASVVEGRREVEMVVWRKDREVKDNGRHRDRERGLSWGGDSIVSMHRLRAWTAALP